jgi:hypothetical protein
MFLHIVDELQLTKLVADEAERTRIERMLQIKTDQVNPQHPFNPCSLGRFGTRIEQIIRIKTD